MRTATRPLAPLPPDESVLERKMLLEVAEDRPLQAGEGARLGRLRWQFGRAGPNRTFLEPLSE